MANLKIQPGPTNACSLLDVFVFKHPRSCNSRIYVSTHSLHEYIGIKGFSNLPSQWVSHSKESWQMHCKQWIGCCDDAFVESTMTNWTNKTKHSETPFSARCLPLPSMSLPLALVQCSLWGWQRPQRGGLKDDGAIAASRSFVEVMVHKAFVVARDEGWKIVIEVRDEWWPAWPYPQSRSGCPVFTIDVRSDDTLDLNSMMDTLGRCPRGTVGHRWFEKVKAAGIIGDNLCSTPAFLVRFLCSKLFFKPMTAQLLLYASSMIHLYLIKNAQNGGEHSGNVSLKWHNDVADGDYKLVGHRVAQYIANVRDLCPAPPCIGIMTDKAWMHGLPIQMTAFTYINNIFSVACPAVALGDHIHLLLCRSLPPLEQMLDAISAWKFYCV